MIFHKTHSTVYFNEIFQILYYLYHFYIFTLLLFETYDLYVLDNMSTNHMLLEKIKKDTRNLLQTYFSDDIFINQFIAEVCNFKKRRNAMTNLEIIMQKANNVETSCHELSSKLMSVRQ